MTDNLNELYRDIIMDHYKYPRHRHKLDSPDITSEGKNPVCGDEIEMTLKIDGDQRIVDVGVECAGCAISVASGSMLSDIVNGKSLLEVKEIARTVKAILKGEEVIDSSLDLGDLESLKGVRKFPVRIKCALLSWTALVDAIESFEKGANTARVTTE